MRNFISPQHLRRLVAFVAAVFASLAIGAVDAAGYPPETVVVSADDTFVNDFDCSFPLIEEISGSYRNTIFFDQAGVKTRQFLSPQFEGALMVTWTNPVTGTSLASNQASSLMIDWNPDGSFKRLSNQGLTFQVAVPGYGLLLIDVGRIEIVRGFGITAETGRHQEIDGDTAAFCGYLAQ